MQSINERKVWYLLLNFGLPIPGYGKHLKRHFRFVRRECNLLYIRIRSLSIPNNISSNFNNISSNFKEKNSRYLFRFLWYKRNDAKAIRLAEALDYGLSLVHGPMIDTSHDLPILRIPDCVIRGRDAIPLKELIELEKNRPFEERMIDFPYSTIGSYSTTTADRFEDAWRIVRVAFNNSALFNAIRYMGNSSNKFYISPGEIGEVLDEDIIPNNSASQTRFEDALQNAFKAIEAVIGDPPKDDRKFFMKLRNIGMNPKKLVGWDRNSRIPIYSVIRSMNQARDKRPAHGSTGSHEITPAELFNFQCCARYVVLSALKKALGKSVF